MILRVKLYESYVFSEHIQEVGILPQGTERQEQGREKENGMWPNKYYARSIRRVKVATQVLHKFKRIDIF